MKPVLSLPDLDDSVWRVVHQASRILRPLDTEWAIGGAVAMAANGYVRATSDVDVFVADDARDELLEGLERLGHTIRAINAPLQYSVGPEHRDHVEFLFPSDMPEVQAIWKPIDVVIKGEVMPVMRCEYLVASKLLIEPNDPRSGKDEHDLLAMRDRGLIDGPKVLDVLNDCPGSRNAKARLRQLLAAERSWPSRSAPSRSAPSRSAPSRSAPSRRPKR